MARPKNREGLTYLEWLDASGMPRVRDAYNAWQAGEDPTEWVKDVRSAKHPPMGPKATLHAAGVSQGGDPTDPSSYYNVRVTGVGVKIDPYFLARTLNITDHELFTVFKKIGWAGTRGPKDKVRDVKESIAALQRYLELVGEG